jgi:uncharacterized protein
MKLKRTHIIPSLLFVICLLSNLLTIPTAQAATDNMDTPHIIDDANILSDVDELDDLANNYSKKHDTSIIVVTTDNTNGLSTVDYASDYYDTYIHGQDGYNNDCVLYLIDMEHRNTNIYAYEDAATRMNTKRCDMILDIVTPKLADGDYDEAVKTFITKTNTFLGEAPDNNSSDNYSSNYSVNNSNNYSDNEEENIFFKLWFQILISVIIGATTVGIMISNSGGRVTTNSTTYLDQSNSKLTGCYDHYIRTTTTRRKKPENNNHSGGSSGGVGGSTKGGSSFSSGHGRSF